MTEAPVYADALIKCHRTREIASIMRPAYVHSVKREHIAGRKGAHRAEAATMSTQGEKATKSQRIERSEIAGLKKNVTTPFSLASFYWRNWPPAIGGNMYFSGFV